MCDDPFFPFFIDTMLKKNGPFLLKTLRVNKVLLLLTRLDQDLEKDYYFGSPSTNNMADLRWFALGLGSAAQDFSLGFWFRYFRNGGTGTILAMYAERYVYQVSLQHRQTHRLFFQRNLWYF